MSYVLECGHTVIGDTKGERDVPRGIPALTEAEITRDLDKATTALRASNGWEWLLNSEGPFDVETVRAALSARFRKEISDDAVRNWFHKLPSSAKEQWGSRLGLHATRAGLIVFFYHRLGGGVDELLDDEAVS